MVRLVLPRGPVGPLGVHQREARPVRYEPLADLKVGQLCLCLDCVSLVPIRYRAHHDAWHAHVEHIGEVADAFPFVPAHKRQEPPTIDELTEQAIREPY